MYNLLWQQKSRVATPATALILLLVTSLSCVAQKELNLPDHDDKKFYLGIGVMYNTSRLQIGQHSMFLQSDSVLVVEPENSGGLGLSGMFTYNISKRFQIRASLPEFMFAYKNLTYHLKYPEPEKEEKAVMTKHIESILVGMPIHIKFRSDRIDNFRVYMFGGGKFEYDLASNSTARRAEDLVKLKKYNLAVEGGIGFNFYFPVFILSPEIKFSNGISNIHSRDANLKYSNTLDRLSTRMVVFSLIFEG